MFPSNSNASKSKGGLTIEEFPGMFRRPVGNSRLSLENVLAHTCETHSKMDHDVYELRKALQALKSMHSHFNHSRHSDTLLYKTQMCRNIQINGHCKYGSNCSFAHSIKELRSVPSNLPNTP